MKTQIKRFMNGEIAIKVKNEKEFDEFMELCGKNGVTPFAYFDNNKCIFENRQSRGLCRTSSSKLTTEDFQQQSDSIIKRVLVNGNATIVFFNDGTKQVVKHTDDLPYDLEKAAAVACAKKMLGGYTELEKALNMVSKVKEKKYIGKIVDADYGFPTYEGFFSENKILELKKGWRYGKLMFDGDKILKVLFSGYHKNRDSYGKVFLVETQNGIYLMEEKGVKFY